MPNVSLSFLHRRKVREVCRVCHELAELRTERLCATCGWIKTKILLRFPDADHRMMATPAQQQCKRFDCLCAACSLRTLGPHPAYSFGSARADQREIHFHPRCHELWLEIVKGEESLPSIADQ